jgi:Holliday junction resolvase RusA-like endonuclease
MMTIIAEFFVPGTPQPGGSKRAFVINGHAVVTDANKKAKSWKFDVALAAMDEVAGRPVITGAVQVSATFVFARPKAQYRTGKYADKLKDWAPKWHTKKPDALKVMRSTEDAMTGIVYKDDSQICVERIEKVYGDRKEWYGDTPGAHIKVMVE